MIIHQIFGLLGDTELPPLFKKCQAKVLDWCTKNNYEYKLWDVEDCEELIKKYPKYADMYFNVRYSIMRVDIIRFVILYHIGGCYIDLDIAPNISKLLEYGYDLAFNTNIKNKKSCIDMEIIQAKKSNPTLFLFLDYVIDQIKDKNKVKIYDTWKIRYVYQTTGPRSLTRFLRLNNNNIQYNLYHTNTAEDKPPNTAVGFDAGIIGDEDFFSYQSLSYKKKMDIINLSI